MSVIWHELECGAYRADLPLWRSLAREHGDPVLDIGAGAGRVTLDLAAQGFSVTALDIDPLLIAELTQRAQQLPVTAVVGDARDFDLGRRFPLCLVPMQTIQLLRGSDQRRCFLRCARRHLERDGLLALAITETLELYDVHAGTPAPLPDMREVDGVVYSSQPTAVRADGDGFILERCREVISPKGDRTVESDLIRLDRVSCEQLEREAATVGLRPGRRATVPETRDHVGSEVVLLRG